MKKIRQQVLSLVLVLGILVSLCPSVFALHAGDELWWTKVGSEQDYKIDSQVHSSGSYVLFTSDVHRYAYLVKELLATANAEIEKDGGSGNVGLMAFGGDFANEYVLYEDNMRILKAALETSPGTVATYTKGNHEGNMSDAEFEAFTGMSRIGETAVNEDGKYHFFNFGAESNSQQFSDGDIAQLEKKLQEWGPDGNPIVIVSHFPLHYYNDRRSTKQAGKLIDILNQYPQAIFLWGHNHTEQDPNYGMIRVPGDIIQPEASAGSAREINFTYACLGALRDGTNGANGLLVRFDDDGTATFRYLQLNAAASDDSWTDAQGNENAVRYTSNEGVSSTVQLTWPTAENLKVIDLANVQLQRPLVDGTPAGSVKEYSPRFDVGSVTWTTEDGSGVNGNFTFNTVYKATFTLTTQDGYTFGANPVVSVNKQYVGPLEREGANDYNADINRINDHEITATFTFEKTVEESAPVAPATSLQNGVMYAMVAVDGNMAASYVYDPAQHGEESRPEYTVAPTDVVVRDGNLVSEAPGGASFVAQKDSKGFMLWSDYSLNDGQGATTLNYLSLASRGPEQSLQAGETVDQAIYADWYLDEAGKPYLDLDGGKRYPIYAGGAFGFTANAGECNVRLYPVSSSNKIYNVAVDVPVPVAGQTPVTKVDDVYGGYTVTNIQWSSAGAFAYDTAYTVTATVQLKAGQEFAAPMTGRVSGKNAQVKNNGDGTATLTYTFGSTGKKPNLTSGLQAKEVSALKNGGVYVIVSGGQAMSALPEQDIYLGSGTVKVSGDRLVDGLRADMFFTATASGDAFVLGQNGQFLGANAVEPGSPDVWGFAKTDKAGSAVTWSYAGGVLKAESTGGGGPGGPPPGGADMPSNTLYMNDGHFNFSTFKTSDVKIYEVINPFTDITADRWSYDKIYSGAYYGIIRGMTATTFAPEQKLSRGMAVTMIYRIAGCPEATGTLKFKDTTRTDYYTDALRWAVANKIVVGYEDNTFRPDQVVTREEAFKMAGLAFGNLADQGKGKTYTDEKDIGSFAKEPIANLTKAGVLEGYAVDGTIRPKQTISREEAIKTFMAIYERLP